MTSRGASSRRGGPVELAGAASTLLRPLAGGRRLAVNEVVRTRHAVHYETPLAALPVLCVATPDAVRLPNTLVAESLPPPVADGETVIVSPSRWWSPPRPAGLPLPRAEVLARLPLPAEPRLDPSCLIGRGPGLTPTGDDLLAAALVTARATHDPRLGRWSARTRIALASRRTTAVSRGLLHHALDGYATPELAACLSAVCGEVDPEVLDAALQRLRSVGHSSGDALLAGVAHVLGTRRPHPALHEGVA